MEILAIIAALGAGAHYLQDSDQPNTIHSSQTTDNTSKFRQDLDHELNFAHIDWSKAGNFKVGDSSENGVQWVFITN
jgi:hypothetical protein